MVRFYWVLKKFMNLLIIPYLKWKQLFYQFKMLIKLHRVKYLLFDYIKMTGKMP